MANIFPKWMNRLPVVMGGGGAGLALFGTLGVAHFFSPAFTDVGYQPEQPIAYSHALHAGELGIDCRYCHVQVERSPVATVPSTQICMNCHALVKTESEQLALLRESHEAKEPIQWVRVHKVPEYAYFHHAVHLNASVGCSSCHGDVASMEEVRQVETLSMGWCLECHRNPAAHIRPRDQLTNTQWQPPAGGSADASGGATSDDAELKPSTDCTACHR